MEDLNRAIAKIHSIINDLPRKVFYVRESLEDLRTTLPDQEKDRIFKQMHELLENIIGIIDTTYEDPDEPVVETSKIFHRFVEFRTRLEAYQEAIFSNEIFQIMEKRFERIESILPSSNFDFRLHVQEIQEGYLGGEVIQSINNAITKFDKGEFHEAISKCGIANESLAFRFKDYLKDVYRIELSQNKVAPLLDEIKKQLQNTSDKERFTLAKSGRLEWFLRSLLEAGHFLRNLGSHSTESEEDLPEWVKIYRKSMTSRVEYARLALVCIIQAAKELQELIIRNKP